jgi:hypothetical protein
VVLIPARMSQESSAMKIHHGPEKLNMARWRQRLE